MSLVPGARGGGWLRFRCRLAPTATSLRLVARSRQEMLLPPACHKPLLHADLCRRGLLPLRTSGSLNPATWRQLLPAPASLLGPFPLAGAGLIALPPAAPLREAVWLLVRLEDLGNGWVEEVGAGVRERVGVELAY